MHGQLQYELAAFPPVEDHLVIHFKSKEDWDSALAGGLGWWRVSYGALGSRFYPRIRYD